MTHTPAAANDAHKKNRSSLDPLTIIQLWVRAGARCSFPGCNEYLLRDSLTMREANLAHVAHIVAAEPGGPRGCCPVPFGERNRINNLMLMCLRHHRLVDRYPDEYPVERLRQFKDEHERRIIRLTGTQANLRTTILRMTATVGDQRPQIPFEQICAAIAPRYPLDEQGIEVSLTQLPADEDPFYWERTALVIAERVSRALGPKVGAKPVEHLSVFAIAPIPTLVHLGSQIGSLTAVDLYQRHRDTDDWTWKEEANAPIQLTFRAIRAGAPNPDVGLILSISGTVNLDDLPELNDPIPLYEITLATGRPHPCAVRTRSDLDAFRRCYLAFLAEVRRAHPEIQTLHVFPAVPAPVAVLCGREVLPKVHPTLAVYDFHRSRGRFEFALRTNKHDSQ